MGLDRLVTDDQGLRDLLIAESLGHQTNHVTFPFGKLHRRSCGFARGPGLSPGSHCLHQFARNVRVQMSLPGVDGPDGPHQIVRGDIL